MIQSHNDKSTKNKERYTSDLRRLWLCNIVNTAVKIHTYVHLFLHLVFIFELQCYFEAFHKESQKQGDTPSKATILKPLFLLVAPPILE